MTDMKTSTGETIQDNEVNSNQRAVVELDTVETLVMKMISDPNMLKSGYQIFSKYEMHRNFYLNFLKVIFSNESNSLMRKLACSSLHIFIRKNWSDDLYITNDERLEVVSFLLGNINNEDYFLKNYIAKLLGLIAAREFPHCYEGFIKIILENLQTSQDTGMIDMLLRIITCVLKECDDRAAIITGEMLPVILNVFKTNRNNQKNREKCLKIVALLLNKLSYADGTIPELITKNLDTNELIDNCLALFTSILVSNPKLLFDIKKNTINILVRDMPIYSSKFFIQLIEPSWRLIVLELSLYTDVVIFNKPIEFTETEEIIIDEENHNYTRGYESDDDEEKYGLEGLILELVDFSIDLLKRNNVMEGLRSVLLTFLLCAKGYLLMPHNSILLWKDDPNLYISEEYDDENINTVRNKTLSLIKEITKEIDDCSLLSFLKIILSEFTEGVNIENYQEVIKLDDYNVITPYFEKMNSDSEFIQRRHEANLLLIGTLAEELLLLINKQKIGMTEIEDLINFLFTILSSPNKENSILVGRAIWCISKMLCLVKSDVKILEKIFEGVAVAFCHDNSDLSIRLVSAQCLSIISQRLLAFNQSYDSDYIIKNYIKLMDLLPNVNEETMIIPIDTIFYLSKLNKEKALFIPMNAITPIIEIYSKSYNDPVIGVKILELIKLWCNDNRSAKILMNLFVPFAIFVFDDFFKNLGKPNQNFEAIKKTVMTEHGSNKMDIKTSMEMLPNLIDIISMLTKYCAETGDNQNINWISLIVNVICEILLRTTDIAILQRGSAFLRLYIPLCAETIEKQQQNHTLLKVIMRFFDPALLESALLFVGNVVSQYFFHVEKQIVPSVLECIVRRIYKAKMPSIVQSLVLVYSRFINKYPIDTLTFLSSIQVENKVGLKVLIDKWLLHQPLFRGKYFKNMSIKALSILFEMKNNIIESLMVIGYNPSHSNASVEVNAPFKILSVLIRCLHNEMMQEQVKKEKTDYENLNFEEHMNMKDNNDEEDNYMERMEYDDNDEEGKKLDINEDEFKNMQEEPRDLGSKLNFINLQGRSGGLNNLETGSEIYLSEMLGFDYNDIEGEEEDNTEEDLVYLTDLDCNFALKDYLLGWLKSFKSKDEEYLAECLKVLPKDDQALFKKFKLE